MNPPTKYSSPVGLRHALETRLNHLSKEKGMDVQRLRRQVAFDRFLARMLSPNGDDFVLKGGYALELILEHARTTRDIDISCRFDYVREAESRGESTDEALRAILQNRTTVETEDFFAFVIGKASLDLDNAPSGGYRFPIEARLAGRLFIRFDIDIAFGDVWLEPHNRVQTHEWLAFAGIEAPWIPVISPEQQFAEKLHAYTLPRKKENSRVKDILDLVLLIEQGRMEPERIQYAVASTFQRRQTHDIPDELPEPPNLWKTPFLVMTKSVGYSATLDTAFAAIQAFWAERSAKFRSMSR